MQVDDTSEHDVRTRPWTWVPSLYFAQALPNVFVTTVSTYAYARLAVSEIVIGYSSWLGLPWMLKALWSPLVEVLATERRWIWTTELFAAGAFLVVGWGFTTENFLLWTMVGYALLAIASATHDIAADGYYMRVLSTHDQAWFTGIRSVAFRGGLIYAEGAMVLLAGQLMAMGHPPAFAWGITHGAAAATFLLLAVYHLTTLPIPPALSEKPTTKVADVLREAVRIFDKFLAEMPLATALPFLLFYRFAESQLAKFIVKFLLDPRSEGGLGLLEKQIGVINGTFGVLALLAGGVLGSVLAARFGLRRMLLPMVIALNVPNLIYLALAYYQPEDTLLVAVGVAVEKFGYGFGFTGYMLYMLYLARGKHQTSFYAILTGFMTLGLILPQSFAGYLLKWLGYFGFFTWIMIATIPSFLVTAVVYWNLDPSFGRREGSP